MSEKLKNYLSVIIESLNPPKPSVNLFPSAETNKMQKAIETINGFDNVSHFELFESICLFFPEIALLISFFFLLGHLCLNYNALPNKKDLLFEKQVVLLIAASDCLVFAVLVSFYAMHLITEVNWFEGLSAFGNSFVVNIYSQYMKLVAGLIISFLSRFLLLSTGPKGNFIRLEQPILIVILLLLTSVMASSGNFVLLLLALESFSLTLYLLPTQDRTYGGVTAAFKYFSFGTLGSILIFWGAALLYYISPTLSYKGVFFLSEYISLNYYSEYAVASTVNSATTLILLGFLVKLGAAPVHQWVADVYAGSPMFVTGFFSTFVKFVFFMLFILIASHTNVGILIDFVILASLIVGCYMTLRQSEIKRFLAYSSIVHVGFLLMGDLVSSFIYIITYIVSSLVIFSVLMSLRVDGKELLYLNDLRLLRRSSYRNIVLVTISLASSAGLPPFAGFYGKYLVWVSLLEDIYLFNSFSSYLILCVSIFLSLITIFYYVRLISYLFVGDDSATDTKQVASEGGYANWRVYCLQAFACGLLVFWTVVHGAVVYHVNLAALSSIQAWLIS